MVDDIRANLQPTAALEATLLVAKDSRRRHLSSHSSPSLSSGSNVGRKKGDESESAVVASEQAIRAVFVVRKHSRTDERWYHESGLHNLTEAFNKLGVTLAAVLQFPCVAVLSSPVSTKCGHCGWAPRGGYEQCCFGEGGGRCGRAQR